VYPQNGHKNGDKPTEQLLVGGLIDELHDFHIDAGFSAERSGELSMAVDLYEQAVRSKPTSPLAWYNFGDALLALNRFEEAVSALRNAVELSPNTILFHYDLGMALYALRRYDEASKEFAPIIAVDPHLKRGSSSLFLSSMTNLALCHDALGRPDEAAKILSPAHSTAVDLLYNLGRLNYRAKRFADALTYTQAAELLTPESEEVVHLHGSILIDLKREQEALIVLRHATKLDPQCASAWYDLGVTLARLNERKKARSCFQKTLHLAPDYPWTYYDLACLDALEGKREKAFANLELALAYGFRDAAKLRQDPDLRGLRRDSRWKTVVERASSEQSAEAD
jgi:superkiller protein 3